jgi:uncharacterized membrane-anchored protein YitT (DUF2179 family)
MNFLLKNIRILEIIKYVLLIVGCILIAISFNLFLYPNNIAAGGVPGFSIILNKLLGTNVVYIQLMINLPLFIIGAMKHGSNFGVKTTIGTFLIPLFILQTQGCRFFSYNVLLASIFGGIVTGIGLSLIIASQSAICGFSLLAQILYDYTKIKISLWIMILNLAVILMAGFTFNFSGTLYAFISLTATCISIDIFLFFFKFILTKNKPKGG